MKILFIISGSVAISKCYNILKILKDHKIIILKGKNAQREINNASKELNLKYKLEDSITDKKSKIRIIDVK